MILFTAAAREGNIHGFLAVVLKTDLEMTDSEAERAAIIANFENIKTRAQARAYAMQVGERAENARALLGNRITPLPSPTPRLRRPQREAIRPLIR